ncbi:MAG: lysine--tRNA ligase [Methanomicrobiales archaeon HGW-Methanomicrobiales-3]|jgi:lysyl-tRNA synthetase class 2|nr:MAG: lysine--tRNA ligase [Methanomicrobiales archaeon HGW-Methanomicrobiales-3]
MTDPTENTVFDQTRIDKITALREKGVAMFPPVYERKDTISEVRTKYAEITHDKSEESVTVAGRIYIVRKHGKTIFADLGDESGRIQLYIRKNDLGDEQFDLFNQYIERGDIIGVTGHVFRTKLGEITIWVDSFVLLTKAVCSLPEKFHGLKDVEKRYRQRYVDLIVNDENRQTFRNRSRIISLLRRYLDDNGFLEFETPILQPVYGGANARPFTTYHNFLDQKLFLRIAPELYLKRLVVGGFEKVFEISRNFRNEGVDADHNPEFTMVEIYWVYRDFSDMMALCENIVCSIIDQVHGKYELPFGETTLNFTAPWKKLSMEDAVKEMAGIDIFAHPVEVLKKLAHEHKIEDPDKTRNQREYLIAFFEALVEEKLIQPTFIYDYPVENSPLAKRHRTKEGFTERFELFIAGMEVGNGFSELNDPVDQKERFEAQDEKRRLGDVEAQMIDYDFINAIGYGMPPTGGVGIGIDRLVMLLTNNNSIKEVILFPSMKTLKAGEGDDEEEAEDPSPKKEGTE